MYTEIIKIIEGGLIGDRDKIINYAMILADSLENQGELTLASKIRSVLNNKKGQLTSLDSFSTKPVDTETRMEIVDITYPNIIEGQIVLNQFIHSEITNFIEYYRKRDNLLKAGINSANTLLLYGPPGCGKTTIAQYISSVTNLPLVTARLDGLVSSLLGSTAKNIRKVFDYIAKRDCILFLDEFDVVAKIRDDKNELGELKRVVNSLIQNIDTLNNDSILIAATNHHELLDPAIWRRFSKIIILEKPLKEEVIELIKILLKNIDNSIINNVKRLEQLSIAFAGLSHSDIKTIINNSIRFSIIQSKKQLNFCEILRELYFYKNHSIDNQDNFIKFLINNNVTHKEMNEDLNMPLRKIQALSKKISEGD